MLDEICGKEKQVVVGSSIGAWIALHVALQRPQQVKVWSECLYKMKSPLRRSYLQ